MDSIFRVPWSDLAVEDVEAFSGRRRRRRRDLGNEGPDPTKPDTRFEARHVYRSACGLTNMLGGYVVVGTTRTGNDGP
jgi:hypothetical protein